jgi:hypothetical protein
VLVFDISIYNLLGKEVEELPIQYRSNKITLDLSGPKPEIYFLRSEEVLWKFVKE